MKILIGCECSGRVRNAFHALGHDAWSCDFKPCEVGGAHLQCDVLTVLDRDWDMAIFHPDCPYLTCSAEWAYKDGPYHQKVKPGTLVGAARRHARADAVGFVLKLWKSPIKTVVIENPRGHLTRHLGVPQYIQPYQFGDDASKATGIWVRGGRRLRIPPKHLWVQPRMVNGKPRWANQTDSGQNRLSPGENRAADRARTYPGIANGFAENWGLA
jgi:hypothetical protein